MTDDSAARPAAIAATIGKDRLDQLDDLASALDELVAAQLDHAAWIAFTPMELSAQSGREALREVESVVATDTSNGNWSCIIMKRDDGSRFAYACDFFPSHFKQLDEETNFLMLEVVTRLGAWWLIHLWRAADLTANVKSCLSTENITAAAASARALIEGAAAFKVEGDRVVSAWQTMKSHGVSDVTGRKSGRAELHRLLHQAQVGTRIGELTEGASSGAQRKNVLGFIKRLAKDNKAVDVLALYDWLCDAAHPSFGANTVYTAAQGVDHAKTHMAVDIARRPLGSGAFQQGLDPDVAIAAVDVTALANQLVLAQSGLIKQTIADIALTAGLHEIDRVPGPHVLPRPHRNELCPCGSGKKSKRCAHTWGADGDAPG